ncbi:MAG: LysR family transcriptional regulator [Hyphomicrobiales bacterium]
MDLDWDDVRVFVAVARCGSLTQAAGTTGLSQPTLSRKLRKLEDSLGAALFDRLPNQMLLTPIGRRLAELAFEMELSADRLQRDAAVAVWEERQPVRVSSTLSIAEFLSRNLDPVVAAALGHNCEVDLVPSRANMNLAHHQVDIAVRLRHVPEDGLMKVRRIGRVGFAMYGQAGMNSDGPRAVIGLSANRPPPHPAWVDEHARSCGLPVVVRLGEYYMRREAIASGLGVSLLPCFIGDLDQRLKRCSAPIDEIGEDVFLLLHNQAAASAGCRAVADAIADVFRQNAALVSGQTVQPPA